MSLRPHSVYCVLAAFNVSSLFAGGVVEGKVALPPAAPVSLSPSRYENKTPSLIRTAAPPVAVVYLQSASRPQMSVTNQIAAQMLQKEFQFLPAVLPIQTGTAVEFPNLDDAYHNVFSYSKTKCFDLGRYRKDERPAAVVFDQPGVVKLYCEIHEHMRATILVLDTPWFTRTDAEGNFRLSDIPPGPYSLKVWFNEKRVIDRVVDVVEAATLKVEFAAP